MEIAILGGGCFWCLEAVFARLAGVTMAESGYMGGRTVNPTYHEVCAGDTGHAEVVQVTFDPARTSYRELLHVFFAMHDPTTLNRQGNDTGTQYRSVVFYTSDEQRHQAEETIARLNHGEVWPDPIVTAVEPAGPFYKAEDYHQNYYQNNSMQPYCRFVIAPKLHKFEQIFGERMRA